ncbi:MAG: 2-C-methyl-D-erythritol 4-phosphate cytidylyltransferase [Gammaproteobacteria bacterium]|nr:2-C-methyl-D-erythritol 4-phosphate cytidylyltransferase [Gammaproteobacteria bacterium]
MPETEIVKEKLKSKIVAIIPAAGSGTRMGETTPKQYLEINGVPMIFHTLRAFVQVARIQQIAVVIASDDADWNGLNNKFGASLSAKLVVFRVGGATRALSVLNGLHELADHYTANDWALVHDAARPCITTAMIEQFLDVLMNENAQENKPEIIGGLLALPVADTLKLGGSNDVVERTVSRSNLWRAQTPQMFRLHTLIAALAQAPTATDESQAIEALGHKPLLVMGDSANLKVTYATDLKIASALLSDSAST